MNDANDTKSLLPPDELRELVRRCHAGDQAALAKIDEFLDAHPELWARLGDLADHVRGVVIDMAAGGDALARSVLDRNLMAKEAELAGPSPSPLRRLLAEQLTLTWAAACLADVEDLNASRGKRQVVQARRRHERLNRLFQSGVRLLATVDGKLPKGKSSVRLLSDDPDGICQWGETARRR